jgi:16S rRNA (uracil1498-N3)-methyltransferase
VIELAGSAAHVVVDDLDALELTSVDEHHLARVLRLRVAEAVSATDGRGGYRWCRWNGQGLDADGERQHEARPEPSIGVGFGLVKGDRVEWIVQKLTELGVDRIIPVACERSVVHWEGERGRSQVARLVRIAREACMQSRRVWLPEVLEVTPAAVLLVRPGVARADADGAWPDPAGALPWTTVVVGPEGGWSVTERGTGGPAVRLGEHILRTETAAVVAGALLASSRRLGRENASPAH